MTDPAHRLDALMLMARELSHDLNNLLGVIANYTALMQMREPSPRSELSAIQAATEQTLDLVRRLQFFGGRVHTEPVRLDVAACIREAVESVPEGVADAVDVRIGSTLPDIHIEADPLYFRTILDELIANARESATDPVALEVIIDVVEGDDDLIEISVRDNGSGIGAEVLERVIDPFFTTKYRRMGAGLGLSVVNGLVHAHGGRFELRSEPGEGTRATVALPRSV